MKQWWNDRAPREQTALIGLAVLVVVLGFLQFGVRPLLAMHARAQDSYAAALELLTEIEAGARTIQSARPANGEASDVPVRTVAATAATDLGLAITRLQPLENGSLDVWLDNVGSSHLFQWISVLQERHGVAVTRAIVQRNEGATVTAQITLTQGRAP